MQELIVIEPTSVREVYVSDEGIEPILAKVKAEIDQFTVLDMSVKKQRDEIKTRVTKIKKCKTYLENTGKALAAELKKEPKLVDASRKKAKDTLAKWEEEVRQPLTDWENAEEERINAIHRRINAMAAMFDIEALESSTSVGVKVVLDELENIEVDDSFEEFTEYADTTKSKTLAQLYKHHDNKVVYEKEQAELEELRKAKAAQDEKDRLEADLREKERQAQEAERLEAERIKAAEEAVRLEAEKKLADEKERLENEAIALKLQAETAERQKLEAEAAAKQAVIDAEKEAERKAAAAKEAEEQATRRREANKAHKKKINNAAVKCLMAIEGIDKELAIEIVTALAKKEIEHVTISY